jgi:hypothetical protein
MRLFQHEDYNDGSGTFANDISLLELSEELSFSDAVQPISLPSSGQSFNGDDCVISGWGRTSGSGCKYHSIGFVSPVDPMVQSLWFVLDRGLFLPRKLLNQVFLVVKLKLSLRKFYGRHHDLVNRYGISVSQMITDMFHLS